VEQRFNWIQKVNIRDYRAYWQKSGVALPSIPVYAVGNMAVVSWQRCTTSQYISKNRNCEMQCVGGTSDVFTTDTNSWKGETPQTTSETERSIEWQVALTAHQPILENLILPQPVKK